MPPVIRAANASDAEALVALWRGFMDFHAAHDPAFTLSGGAEAARREFLASRLVAPDSFSWIATLGNEALGYAMGGLHMRPPVFAQTRFGHVSEIYVTPARQRSGLGSRLLAECLSWFKERGTDRVEVRALTSNPLSNAFWKRHGFQPFAQESFLRL